MLDGILIFENNILRQIIRGHFLRLAHMETGFQPTETDKENKA